MESYGYRFETPDRSIVISGDTNPTQATIDACRGCDVLVHEVLTLEWLAKRKDFQGYAAQFHTTTAQLIELATKARPKLLVLYHGSLSLRPGVDAERSTPAAMLDEMSTIRGAGGGRPRSGRLLSRRGYDQVKEHGDESIHGRLPRDGSDSGAGVRKRALSPATRRPTSRQKRRLPARSSTSR